MPELPEVEVVRRGLDRWVSGRTVSSVLVYHPRAVRRHVAGPDSETTYSGTPMPTEAVSSWRLVFQSSPAPRFEDSSISGSNRRCTSSSAAFSPWSR